MEESNRKTIESYEAGINLYIQSTPDKRGGVVENWIDRSVENLKPNARILEIGSANGRDAKIIEEKGFYVVKTDATKGFVELLQEDDPNARMLNIITDTIDTTYDLIMANAVFLHFNNEEIQTATSKAFNALNPGGILSITLKKGEGEAWQDNKGMKPRFFNFWSEEEVKQLLTQSGFSNVNVWADASDGSGTTWIMVIASRS